MLFAHPLTQHEVLPVSPLVAAVVVACVIVAVGLRRTGGSIGGRNDGAALHSFYGRLPRSVVVSRSVAVALTLLAALAGRFGSQTQLENIAPALVIGAGAPLLVLASTVAPVWRWIDPWDGAARVLGPPGEETQRPSDVTWALIPAFAWMWYLHAYDHPLEPAAIGDALAIYGLGMIAGAVAVGRAAWLGRAEVFGLLLSWMALIRGHRLREWEPPRRAEAVLGAIAGGVLFGALRASELWGTLNAVDNAWLYALGGVVACALAGALLADGLQLLSDRHGSPGSVAAALVPAVAALVIAFAMARGRLFTSIQFLPSAIGDPFGWEWDLFGDGPPSFVQPSRTSIALVQTVVILAGHAYGAWIAARRNPESGRAGSLIALIVFSCLAIVGVGTT